MPDIAMCPGKDCPLKETCFRHTAKPSAYRQSYFVTPPWRTWEEKPQCAFYIPLAKPEGND